MLSSIFGYFIIIAMIFFMVHLVFCFAPTDQEIEQYSPEEIAEGKDFLE